LKWIEWAQRIQSIAQNGLAYATDKFDIERYKELQNLASEIIANHSNHEFNEIQDYLRDETGYATPKIDVRGVVFRDQKILLVKEISDGKWTLPGGWADIMKSPSENVEGEVFEESGFKVKAKRILAVYDRSRHGHFPDYPNYVYKLFFLCDIIGGKADAGFETSDADFFNLDNLPELSIGRVTKKQITKMFELTENNESDFD
jgi:ADP-ribose pyrophosphatase YjhB (NUDIX family)